MKIENITGPWYPLADDQILKISVILPGKKRKKTPATLPDNAILRFVIIEKQGNGSTYAYEQIFSALHIRSIAFDLNLWLDSTLDLLLRAMYSKPPVVRHDGERLFNQSTKRK